jgi:hypothetical protein
MMNHLERLKLLATILLPCGTALTLVDPRQLVVPDTGSLVVTCSPCSREVLNHASCTACSGAGLDTACSGPLSVPCDELADWLGKHTDPSVKKDLSGNTVLTCEECGIIEEGKSQCTICSGKEEHCYKPYAVACEDGDDLGWGKLVGLLAPEGKDNR